METYVNLALQAATTAWSNYIIPQTQQLSGAVQQIRNSAFIHFTTTQALNFAATPLGAAVIGAVALTALIGLIILIRHRDAEQPQTPLTSEMPPGNFGTVPISRKESPYVVPREIIEGVLELQKRAAQLNRVEETSSVLKMAGLELPILVITQAELQKILQGFSSAEQQVLKRILQQPNMPKIRVIKGTNQGPLRIKDKETTDREPTLDMPADPNVVAVGGEFLRRLFTLPSSSPDSLPKSPQRTNSGRRRFTGSPLKDSRNPTILKGAKAWEAYKACRRSATREIGREAFISRKTGFDTINQRVVSLSPR